MASRKTPAKTLTINTTAKKNRDLSATEFRELVCNVYTMRQELIKQFMDPRRDVAGECGHPSTVTPAEYRFLYDRDPIARRVIRIMPQLMWQAPPKIFEVENAKSKTAFELAIDTVGNGLRGRSWLKAENANPLFEYLRRADELSGIGQYGIILIGVNDGKPLNLPCDGVDVQGFMQTSKAKRPVEKKLLFLQTFDQSSATITKVEMDPSNVRFGMPTEYLITFNGISPGTESTGISTMAHTFPVHWTRVVHVADNIGSNECLGTPRCQPVLNRLLDLIKLYGGSAEMYWRGAFPGLSIETVPGIDGMSMDIDEDRLKTQIGNYMNGLQRYLALIGMTTKSLAPQVVDPTAQINVQLEAICIDLGIAKRKFVGSEQGHLASTSDDGDLNDLLRSRQMEQGTPRLIGSLINRFIAMGILPQPETFGVEWPDFETLSEDQRADIALKKTQAMQAYVSGSVEALMDPIDYLTRIMGYTQDEAKAIVDASMGRLDGPSITGSLQDLKAPPAPIIAPGMPGKKAIKDLPSPKAPVKKVATKKKGL